MSDTPNYVHGAWKVVCDDCGRWYKSFQLQMRWDGVMVCYQCWEPRQPQDFVRGVADKIAPPWTRPEQQDIFRGICDLVNKQGVVGYAVVGCAIIGTNKHIFPQCTPSGSTSIVGYAIVGCAICGV